MAEKEITQALQDWSGPNQAHAGHFVATLYDELHSMARHALPLERTGHDSAHRVNEQILSALQRNEPARLAQPDPFLRGSGQYVATHFDRLCTETRSAAPGPAAGALLA